MIVGFGSLKDDNINISNEAMISRYLTFEDFSDVINLEDISRDKYRRIISSYNNFDLNQLSAKVIKMTENVDFKYTEDFRKELGVQNIDDLCKKGRISDFF